jgi:ribose-phosphate pyrophosphokinase
MSDKNGELAIVGGNANPELTKAICKYLGIQPLKTTDTQFSDGEIRVRLDEDVRGDDVFILQPTCPPETNDRLVELLLFIDAAKRASAKRITAVIPYYGYARQDRKVEPRIPISAKLMADLISAAGAHRIMTMDLHAGQIQGFFNIPVDNLYARPVIVEYVKNNFEIDDLVVVSPDAGGVERARSYAKKIGANIPIAIIDKRREQANVSEVMNVIGNVENKTALIIDDIVDTAGTMAKGGASALNARGAKRIIGCGVHPVLSGPAIKRINDSVLERLIVTDTIPLSPEAEMCQKLVVLSISSLMGEAIKCIHEETSVSSLFT